jgi:protein ImuB
MKRLLALHFPQWALQRVMVARPELNDGRALILFARDTRRGELVVACSRAARAAGVRLNMPLAEATALVERRGRWSALAHDPAADEQALTKLAESLERFSPLVGWETVGGKGTGKQQLLPPPQRDAALTTPDYLLLDITGISPLFGGEAILKEQVLAELAQQGYRATAAVADTIGAAWGMAHSSSHALLDLLPLAALRISAATIERLTQLGIETIGDIRKLPRASLNSRFGEELLLRLDQLAGMAAETIVPWHPLPKYTAEIAFEYPLEDLAVVEQAALTLLEQLAAELTAAQQGALRLACRFDCEQDGAAGRPLQLRIGLFRASASVDHWRELLRMQLEQTSFRGAVGRITIGVLQTGPLEQRQQELFADGLAGSPQALATLVDRLSSRLGEERVIVPELRADPLPERAWKARPGTKSQVKSAAKKAPSRKQKQSAVDLRQEKNPATFPAARPLQLFQPPLPLEVISLAPDGPPQVFRWRGEVQRVAWYWGPERIETGWWRGQSVQRDYYRIETETGLRYWLFRQRMTPRAWYLHGAFG